MGPFLLVGLYHRPADSNCVDAMPDSLEDLTTSLRDFVRARDWEQFHTPKNLAIALLVEAGEVAEHFQWSSAADDAHIDDERRRAIALEIGDTLLYLARLADVLGIDMIEAAAAKMRINAERYPVEKSYGKSTKYDRL
jgi:NTP pyrophosphatase (non-canonical NTP hydrolase)